ncbi:hypothetical protein Cch01nite_25040 [Cellulomonas chitinilytica]|uniref:Uncharacterized protein n=1 Tax=Cellulomonas chitinilytica TaxID=398759 RepID=A0A919P3W0_9CELL|nr:hypothetical protein [Cellulomonas chitinilytica]GIG21780.1 hypothetical protein Cch01nite_25040 [Cellulomonas chitinilytica]
MGDDARVTGSWIRTPEEDHDGVAVYRARGSNLPPSRLRRGLELADDGTMTELGIGRDDTETRRTGRWSAPSPGRLVLTGEGEAPGRTLRVVRLEEDRLEVVEEL